MQEENNMNKKEKHLFVSDDIEARENLKEITEAEFIREHPSLKGKIDWRVPIPYEGDFHDKTEEEAKEDAKLYGNGEGDYSGECIIEDIHETQIDKQKVKEAFGNLRKGAFLYKDTDGVAPDIVFSRGYNQAVEQVKKILKLLGVN